MNFGPLHRHWQSLRARLPAPLRGAGAQSWLLLCWDVGGLEAIVLSPPHQNFDEAPRARSGAARFAQALADVLQQLRDAQAPAPRRVALAARHLVPTVLRDVPVPPERPRPAQQMRELLQNDLEQPLAEFGSLWSLGAVLQARGYLSAQDRERITLEESVRRQNRSSQLRWGEIAIELALIDRAALDECLDLQAALQNLDAQLAAGWRGRWHDKQPVWMACGVGQSMFTQWSQALHTHSLRLDVALPLAWLASAPALANAPSDRSQESWQVDLELHTEELVAIQRHNGQVVAARSEGRVERALRADWLARVVADWVAEPRVQLHLHALHVQDDAQLPLLAEDLAMLSGHPCAVHAAHEVRNALWQHLLAQAQTDVPGVVRIARGETRGPLWRQPDVRRALAVGAVLLGLLAIESVQQYRIAGLQSRLDEHQRAERQRAASQQLTQQANQKLQELAKDLDTARNELAPLLADRSRLTRIVSMRHDLPELMYQLAQAVGSDAVIEEMHNDNTQGANAAIQVVAWSPSYTGAQAFVNRMAVTAHDQGYSVSQTEIRERAGRDGRKGHEVKFWLLGEDLELESAPPPTPSAPANPQSGATAISAQPAVREAKP